MMSQRIFQFTAAAVFFCFLTGCFAVQVDHNVKNPERYFKQAEKEIERLHRKYPRRDGPVNGIQVLVYDADERQLVRVSAPAWIMDHFMASGDREHEQRTEIEEDYNFEWEGLEDLRDLGPGLVLEVEDEEHRILVWIE